MSAAGDNSRRRPTRRGVILVLSLWISMILAIMAFSVAYELRVNMRLSRMTQDRLKARGLARAGLAKSVIDLKNDRLLAVADPATRLSDSFTDVWAVSDDKTDVELGGGTFSVYIDDEDGKFNLDLLTPANAPVVGHLLAQLGGHDPVIANGIAHMILDYQDPDLAVWSDALVSEREYYTYWVLSELSGYVPPDWTFKAKNDRLLNVEELLAIPGITRELLFGDPDDLLDGRRRDRFDVRDGSPALAQHLTVNAGRTLNINTASTLVLEGLMMLSLPVPHEAVEFARRINDYRVDLARVGTGKNSILNLNELRADAVGLGTPEINRMVQVAPIGVTSDFFNIISRGEYRGIRKTIEMRVRVTRETYAVNPEEPRTAGRRDRRANGSLLSFENVVIDPAVRVMEIRDR
jgi:hypothetical protein